MSLPPLFHYYCHGISHVSLRYNNKRLLLISYKFTCVTKYSFCNFFQPFLACEPYKNWQWDRFWFMGHSVLIHDLDFF